MRRATVFVLAAVLLLGAASPALGLRYYRAAIGEREPLGSLLKGYGTYSYNYVPAKPALGYPSGEHAAAVYLYALNDCWTSVGWYWTYSGASPQSFTDWSYYGTLHHRATGALTQARFTPMKIDTVPGTDDHRVYINGYQVHTWYNTGLVSAWSVVDSQRLTFADDNTATHAYLQFREGNVTWKYWYHIGEEGTVGETLDPYYHLVTNETQHNAIIVHD